MWRPGRVAEADRADATPASEISPAPSSRSPFGGPRRPAPAAPSGKPKPIPDRVRWALWAAIALLCIQRCIYHFAFVRFDPFALVTIADGQVYEDAARDILAFPYWGSKPFYLQGAYAYLLAVGIAPSGSVVGGVILQLIIAGLGLVLFGIAAQSCFGPRAGLLSTIVLLASPDLAFYENKYLSVVLGDFACMFLLWAFACSLRRPSFPRACLVGIGAGLCALGRPNLILIVPFCLLGLWFGSQRRGLAMRALLIFGLLTAVACTLTPMALRNLVVTGTPTVFPSHGGGIPFFIGNNPDSNGRWNDAGGLLGRQVSLERGELAERLGLSGEGGDLDAAIGDELYRRAFEFIRTQPFAFLKLELEKAWALFGNHAYVHDYDVLGERELLGAAFPFGLPFGIVLGLGTLGLIVLTRRAFGSRHESEHAAICSVSFGLVVATLVANLAWFTSAQHRVPLYIPLAFAAGPAIQMLVQRARREVPASALPPLAWIAALVLCAQAFYPRQAAERPSSTHYFNLANVEEELGRHEEALAHYALATERNPKQPAYWWRRALLARRMRRIDDARLSLDRLLALPDLPPKLRDATQAARTSLH